MPISCCLLLLVLNIALPLSMPGLVGSKARTMQIRIYEDEEGVRKLEFDRLSGQNQFSTFYERLKEVKDYYRRNPTADLTEAVDDDEAIDAQVSPIHFLCVCLMPQM